MKSSEAHRAFVKLYNQFAATAFTDVRDLSTTLESVADAAQAWQDAVAAEDNHAASL